MPRRMHRKSRNGCADCKRRHVKCDEGRPGCVHCKTANIPCTYSNERVSRVSSSRLCLPPSPPLGTPVGTPGTSTSTGPSVVRDADVDMDLRLDQLELLHQFSTETYRAFTITENHAQIYRRTVVQYGLAYPYLMYQILAVAAHHLSILHPNRKSHYQCQAAELQLHAVAGFQKIGSEVDEKSCVTCLLFASLLGWHVFSDVFSTSSDTLSESLDKLTSCIKLLRGIDAITGVWWETIRASDIGPFLNHADRVRERALLLPQEEGSMLLQLIRSADLSEEVAETYEVAIKSLQLQFQCDRVIRESDASVTSNMLFAWPVTLTPRYTELLEQRRPEALIILAHYAILIHRRRGAWSVGAAGRCLLNSIASYLGRHWEKWLAWPQAVINGNLDDSPAIAG